MADITAKEIVKKIRKQLKESGWESALYVFLSSDYFENIFTELIRIKQEDGKRFVPKVQNIMRFLEETPYDKVKCAMLVDINNNRIDINEGIAMHSTRMITIKDKEEPVLPTTAERMFYSTIHGDKIKYDKDILHVCQQGVLMIPVAPTSEMNGKEHTKLWEPFISYLVDHLNHNKKNIPYILINKSAHAYRDIIQSPNQVELTMQQGKVYESKDWPNWLNRILKQRGHEEIKW